MNITTMHTLTFTFRASNGKHQLAEDIITTSAKTVGVTCNEIKSLPLPNTEDAANRNSQVSVCCDRDDKLELYWTQLQQALGLIGVEATSP